MEWGAKSRGGGEGGEAEMKRSQNSILLLPGVVEMMIAVDVVVAVSLLRLVVVRSVGLLLKRKYYTCFHRKEFRRISSGGFAGCDSFLMDTVVA